LGGEVHWGLGYIRDASTSEIGVEKRNTVIMARSGIHQGGESKGINTVRSIIDRGRKGKELKHSTNGVWSTKGSTIGTGGYSGFGALFMRRVHRGGEEQWRRGYIREAITAGMGVQRGK